MTHFWKCWLWPVLALFCLGAARAANNDVGKRPYMGWSSWSLQATLYPGYGGGPHWRDWLTADHVKAQSEAMHRLLQRHGYVYLAAAWERAAHHGRH